jgi:hypothetical protein
MTGTDDLLNQIPLDQIAQQVGADRADVEAAVRSALPALLGGLHANAQDPAGAASLLGALQTKDPALLDGGVDLQQVDQQDGQKIVRNVFGDNTDHVVRTLGQTAPGGSSLVSKILPMIAPIVLAYLAKRLTGHGRTAAGSTPSAAPQGGQGGVLSGGLGDLLGGLLGGATKGAGGAGGIDIGGLLGGLLGGGKR